MRSVYDEPWLDYGAKGVVGLTNREFRDDTGLWPLEYRHATFGHDVMTTPRPVDSIRHTVDSRLA